MATVLGALVPCVAQRIKDNLEKELRKLTGISGEIKKIGDKVESLDAFLAIAERAHMDDDATVRVRLWMTRLKGALYEATDILDLCQLDAMERHKGPQLRFYLCNQGPGFVNGMGSRVKELSATLDGLCREGAYLRFEPLGSCPGLTRTAVCSTSLLDESALVGDTIDADTNRLVQLLQQKAAIMVVSIVGAAGMGKTTLAQKIFNDEAIQAEFSTKIWLSVTHEYTEEELLGSAIVQAGGGFRGDNKQMLTQTLAGILSASKFLLVMDDVWSDMPWAQVFQIPVIEATDNYPGSRVIITTRNQGLVRLMGVTYHQHHVRPLSDEDSWSLLKKQLWPKVVGIDQHKHICTEVIKRCGGLPLAVEELGRLLKKGLPELDWSSVWKNNIWSVAAGFPAKLYDRLYLSYLDLSPLLKQCFLYCSLFPEGTLIERDVVTSMWISEGFFEHQYGCFSNDGQELADECYQELITRNLIEPTASYLGDVCTMHNVMRSFARFLSREESSVVEDYDDPYSLYQFLVRRLSIGPAASAIAWSALVKQWPLRTLVIFHRTNLKPDDSLTCFSNLRVLHIRCEGSDRFLDSLCQLKHLRYLHLEHTDISRLPGDIGNMMFLEHIKFVNCKKLCHLPGSLTKLVQLRTICLDGSSVNVLPKGFGELTNLTSLSGIPVQMNEGQCSLGELVPLFQLRDLRIKGLEKVHHRSCGQELRIEWKTRLSYLELNCNRSRPVERNQQVIKEVFDVLRPPASLENLVIGQYFGQRLPNWMWGQASKALERLRYIKLDVPYCTELPDGLCWLPNLISMVIDSGPAIKCVGPEFHKSSCSVEGDAAATSTGFPRLKTLEFNWMCAWEEWKWNFDEHSEAAISMPILERLAIKECTKLKSLPPGLANSNRLALRELKLHNLTSLKSVDNFPSLVELDLFRCCNLKKISDMSTLKKIRIVRCPSLEVLEGVPALDNMHLWDISMGALPKYLLHVNPKFLRLDCNKQLCDSLVPGSSEWDKISHINSHIIDYYPKFDEDQ